MIPFHLKNGQFKQITCNRFKNSLRKNGRFNQVDNNAMQILQINFEERGGFFKNSAFKDLACRKKSPPGKE